MVTKKQPENILLEMFSNRTSEDRDAALLSTGILSHKEEVKSKCPPWSLEGSQGRSVALVLCIRGKSRFLEWEGSALGWSFGNESSLDVERHLEETPTTDGLFLWEGDRYSSQGESYLSGNYRELTDVELASYMTSGYLPWELDTWPKVR